MCNALLLFFGWSASSQNDFSAYITMSMQPTKNIKMNQTQLGASYTYEYSSKFKLITNLDINSKSITYPKSIFHPSLYYQYNELKNTFTLNFVQNSKQMFEYTISPIFSNENNLKFSSLFVLNHFKTSFKLRNNATLNVGLGTMTALGKPTLLPILCYQYQFNKLLTASVGFPESKISYSNNNNLFTLKNNFNGTIYKLDQTPLKGSNTFSKATFSQMSTSFTYERNVDKYWYLHFIAGYDFNRKYLLVDKNYKTSFDFMPQDGYNIGLTIKYKY